MQAELLVSGGEYRVRRSVNTWGDEFVAGEILVFLDRVHSVYDSRFSYLFFDCTTGQRRVYNTPDEQHLAAREPPQPNDVFILVGGWIRPERIPHDPPKLGAAALGLQSANLQVLLPYLKDLVEGKPEIENWFHWWTCHGGELTQVLRRTEFLRLKHTPISGATRILDALKIEYVPGVRYAWLG
jgi:hypothetical protein